MTYDERKTAEEGKKSWFDIPKIPGNPLDKMEEAAKDEAMAPAAMDMMMWDA